MPEPDPDRPRLRKSRTDRMLGGVAGGLGRYFGIDANLIRLAFVVLAIAGGSGVLIYLIAWLILPEEEEGTSPSAGPASSLDAETARLMVGGALIAIGAILLASRFVPYFSRIFWPLVLVATGVAVIMGARKR